MRYKNIGSVAAYVLTISICTAYGLSDEIHQSFVPNRVFDWYDLLADFLGVCFSIPFGIKVFPLDYMVFKKLDNEKP